MRDEFLLPLNHKKTKQAQRRLVRLTENDRVEVEKYPLCKLAAVVKMLIDESICPTLCFHRSRSAFHVGLHLPGHLKN
jgi:hypothetical protein